MTFILINSKSLLVSSLPGTYVTLNKCLKKETREVEEGGWCTLSKLWQKAQKEKSTHDKMIGKKYTFAHFLMAAKIVEKR